MMKRTAALVLAAALVASLVLPAAAADEATQDARLTQVTQAVKDTLDLVTSEMRARRTPAWPRSPRR